MYVICITFMLLKCTQYLNLSPSSSSSLSSFDDIIAHKLTRKEPIVKKNLGCSLIIFFNIRKKSRVIINISVSKTDIWISLIYTNVQISSSTDQVTPSKLVSLQSHFSNVWKSTLSFFYFLLSLTRMTTIFLFWSNKKQMLKYINVKHEYFYTKPNTLKSGTKKSARATEKKHEDLKIKPKKNTRTLSALVFVLHKESNTCVLH